MLHYKQHYSLGIVPSLDEIENSPHLGTTVYVQPKPGEKMTLYVFDGLGWVKPTA